MEEALYGLVAAIAIILIVRVCSRYISARLFAATILVAIAFIYVGFSLKQNPAGSIVLEAGMALVLYFLALIGYVKNNNLLGYGIMAHGVWDILHHNGWIIGTDVPVFWPTFCFVIDMIDGLYFLWLFSRQKKQPGISPAR